MARSRYMFRCKEIIMHCFHGTTLYVTHQYDNDKKMTIVNRYNT